MVTQPVMHFFLHRRTSNPVRSLTHRPKLQEPRLVLHSNLSMALSGEQLSADRLESHAYRFSYGLSMERRVADNNSHVPAEHLEAPSSSIPPRPATR